MQNFTIPIGLLHHTIADPITSNLTVSVPKYNVKKTFEFNELPQDIFKSNQVVAQTEIQLSVHAASLPYVIDFTFAGLDDYITCVLFCPKLNVTYRDLLIQDVPVRTISLKHNGQEISNHIPGLEAKSNFRSWVNPHIKNNHKLTFRLYCDVRYAVAVQQNLNML